MPHTHSRNEMRPRRHSGPTFMLSRSAMAEARALPIQSGYGVALEPRVQAGPSGSVVPQSRTKGFVAGLVLGAALFLLVPWVSSGSPTFAQAQAGSTAVAVRVRRSHAAPHLRRQTLGQPVNLPPRGSDEGLQSTAVGDHVRAGAVPYASPAAPRPATSGALSVAAALVVASATLLLRRALRHLRPAAPASAARQCVCCATAAVGATEEGAATGQDRVIVFTSRGCPFCVRAKTLLQEKGWPFTEISLTEYPEKREDMLSAAERATVPQIFINGTHVGGCDDLYAMEAAGSLEALYAMPPAPSDSRLQKPLGPPSRPVAVAAKPQVQGRRVSCRPPEPPAPPKTAVCRHPHPLPTAFVTA